MYVTKSGDTWDVIAKRLYGNEVFMVELMRANPEHMNVVIFPSSIRLVTPEIKAVKTTDCLPPWKRGRG